LAAYLCFLILRSCPGIVNSARRRNLHHLLIIRYAQEASRTLVAVDAQREEKSISVARLEGVLPLLGERFGVARIGIFGSIARGEDRPDSDVDILVEFAPGETTFLELHGTRVVS